MAEKQYFAKLAMLILDEGTAAMRMVFDSEHPPGKLQASLQHHRTKLDGLRKRPRVLHQSQWELLFPTDGKAPDSAEFDITLLYVLLRNICSFKKPTTGWDDLPPPSDTSREASMAVIKHYRNNIFAHVTGFAINEKDFHNHWARLSDAVVNLGGDKDRVDLLKEGTFSTSQIKEVVDRVCNMEQKLGVMAENHDKQAMQIDGLTNKLDAVAAEQGDIKDKVDAMASVLSSQLENSAASSSQPQGSKKRHANSRKRQRKGIKPLQDLNGSGPLDPEKQYPLPQHPRPDLGCYELGMIKYMHGKIEKCYGCKRNVRFKRKAPPASPYGDLLLATRGDRIYGKNPDGTNKTTVSNIYFHVNKYCVARHCQDFCPSAVHVANDLKLFLQPEHRRFIKEFGINLTP